uniref:ORF68 n=1 Tax=Malaco herpesvirus 1 TaxID=3031797 RepID=A0AA48P945_9VIRU|nr:TPA_asm: ORF68 [Malaco herpesvirus 1]
MSQLENQQILKGMKSLLLIGVNLKRQHSMKTRQQLKIIQLTWRMKHSHGVVISMMRRKAYTRISRTLYMVLMHLLSLPRLNLADRMINHNAAPRNLYLSYQNRFTTK